MSYLLAGLGAALVLSGAGAQTRPATDDWAFATDRTRELSIASVSYSSGVTLSVQCLAGDLMVAITGLPANAAAIRRYDRRVEDGRTEQTVWAGASGNGISNGSARLARTFRRGGRLQLNASPAGQAPVEIALDLPAQSTNIDRVLTACGLPLADAFDGALNVGDLLIRQPTVSLRQSSFRSYEVAVVSLECLVAGGRLASCRAVKAEPPSAEVAAAAVNAANGRRLALRDAAAAEGRVVELVVSNLD